MCFMPFQSQGALDSGATHESGYRPYRYRVPSLVYVNLDQGNGGIVRDISTNGIGIQAVGRLRAGQTVLTRFDLLNPRTRVEASAEVVWADDSGQAGLRFSQFPERMRRGLNDWIFTNLLATMDHVAARASMFQPTEECDRALAAAGVHLRSTPLRAHRTKSESDSTLAISLPFWPTPVSMRTVWLMMDGLLIMTAVLLFWVVFLAVARALPPWPVTIGLAGTMAIAFALAYRQLFRAFAIESPGCFLATRAAAEETLEKIRGIEAAPRFR
jgi:hypothetical protein